MSDSADAPVEPVEERPVLVVVARVQQSDHQLRAQHAIPINVPIQLQGSYELMGNAIAYINQNARCYDDADYRVRSIRKTTYLMVKNQCSPKVKVAMQKQKQLN